MDNDSVPKREWEEGFQIKIPLRPSHLLALIFFGILSVNPGISWAQETGPVADKAKTPASPSDLPSDDAILKRLPELSTDYIRNLLGIYARLGNADMSKALTGELNRRDPGGAEVETPESIAKEAMENDTDPPNPYEDLENRIDAVMTAQKYAEAIALMERLRSGQFAGKSFPFEIELGDAYGSTGNFEAAKGAYTRAAQAKGASTEQKKLAQAGLVEIEKLESLKIAYDLIEKKQPAAALLRAEALKNKHPEDVDVQLLYAQALVPNYHFLEALPMLEAIKARHFVGKPYPAQDALAETLRATGRLDDARAAYDELSRDNTLPEHIRAEAVLASREVAKLRSATIRGSAEFLSEGEGDAVLARGHGSAPIAPGLHAGVNAWYYDVSLSGDRSLRQSSGDFLGAVAFVRKYLDNNLSYLEARAGGGSHEDATLGFTFGKERTYQGVLGYDIALDINTPALDSLQLIALNGIEDKVSANFVSTLPGRFEVTAGAFGRTMEADGADLGNGWGAYFEVGRPVWENVKNTSAITVAYRADYERFDADMISDSEARRLGYAGEPAEGRLLGAELLEPRYHPHGLQVTYESRVTQSLFYFLSSGLYFDFADEEWDYNLSGGLEYALTDLIDLVIEGGYYSDGTGASNDDSAVYVGTIGIRSYH